MDADASTDATTSGSCPRCGANGLERIRVPWSEAANYLCHRCGRCWHVEDGAFRQRDPLTCEGCSRRRVCLAALGERSP